MKPIYLTGVGLWSPGFPGAAEWRERRPDPAVDKPPCRLIGARLGRGSSRFANMLGEVVEQAAAAGGVDVATVPTVYGSSLGEIETMVTLLRMLYEEEGKLSPNRFKNSVHNAASGLVSIATVNTAFTTAIAGGHRTFEVSLLEAWALLDAEGGEVVLAVADDAPPAPLETLGDPHGALAVGFSFSASPRHGALRLAGLRAAEGQGAAFVPAPLRANCAAAGLALLEVALARRAATVSVAPCGQRGLALDASLVEPPHREQVTLP